MTGEEDLAALDCEVEAVFDAAEAEAGFSTIAAPKKLVNALACFFFS